jgi:hypothetical protein
MRKVVKIPIDAEPRQRRRTRRSRDGLFAPQWELIYGSRPRPRAPFNFARRRINEIEKLIQHWHDGLVPDTDDADRYVWVVAQHLGQINRETVEDELLGWCERWAPDFPADQITDIAKRAAKNPHRFGADKLAELLGVKKAERQALGLTTIGAVDYTAQQRAAERAEKKRARECERARKRRRELGMQTRSQYLAGRLSKKKPWERQGISRRTWERQRADQRAKEQEQRGNGEVVEFTPRQEDRCDPPAPLVLPDAYVHPQTEADWEALATRRRRPLGKGELRAALKRAA